MIFIHEPREERYESENGTFVFSLEDGELDIRGRLQGLTVSEPVIFHARAVLPGPEGNFELTGNIDNVALKSLIPDGAAGSPFIDFDEPARFFFKSHFLQKGMLGSTSLSFRFRSGRFHPFWSKESLSFQKGAFDFRYDAGTGVLMIEESEISFGPGAITFSGQIESPKWESSFPDTWRYALNIQKITPSGEANVSWFNRDFGDIISMQGDINFVKGLYGLNHGRISLGFLDASFAGDFFWGQKDSHIQLSGSHPSVIKVENFLDVWPSFLFPPLRKWFTMHILEGTLNGLTLDLELDQIALELLKYSGAFGPDVLNFSFNFEDVGLGGFSSVPQARAVSGNGKLRGSHFAVTIDKGQLLLTEGRYLNSSEGHFEIADIWSVDAQGDLFLSLSGGGQDFLEFFEQSFQMLGVLGKEVSSFSGGEGKLTLNAIIPLSENVAFKEFNLDVACRLKSLSAENFWGDYDLSRGDFLINVRDNVFLIAGKGRLMDADMRMEWAIPLISDSEDLSSPNFTFSFRDEVYKTSFGNMKGPLQVTVIPDFHPDKGIRDSFAIYADLKGTAIDIPFLHYEKKVGASGHILAKVTNFKNGEMQLKDIEFDAGFASVRGELSLYESGRLKSAHFPSFSFHAYEDVSLNIQRQANDLEISLTGKHFDLRRVMRSFLDQKNASLTKWGTGKVFFSGRLDEALGAYGSVLRNMELTSVFHGSDLQRFDLSGLFNDRPVSVRFFPAFFEGGDQRLIIDSADAGSALRFSGFYNHLDGGSLSLLLDFSSLSPLGGILKINNFFLQGEKALNFLSEKESSVGGEIWFDDLYVPFKITDGMIFLEKSFLRGPSLGITVEGGIDFENDRLDLVGTYVPAYLLNHLLGHVPFIGDLIVGGKGGGVLGLTFAVRGSRETPEVLVNPLSLVTPGAFRNLLTFSPLGLKPFFPGTPDKGPARPLRSH
ncbi:MAG: AsmA-like C-terminal region-containing protein [Alphaproteobacteria bacterium]|nr:AsmA-like C-terminal region-containing protein [Alphaproteobacteria bacterium]